MINLLTRLKASNPVLRNHSDSARPPQTKRKLVVLGNGMVGQRLLELMDQAGLFHDFEVTVFGAEPCPATDRVNLTRYLYGASPESLQLVEREWYVRRQIKLHTGDPVVLVDRDERMVYSRSGRCVSYDRLVFATGSRAYRPDIDGASLEGVFVYRDLKDLERIRARAETCESVAVIGGGLLGLEAAEAFKDMGLSTHVIDRGSGLMARQVNPEGSRVLQKQIEAMGVTVHNGRTAESIQALDSKLEIAFRGGSSLEVGMIVFATGIRPRDELARACGLLLGPRGGIKVDDQLTTSDPNIFAIGDCISHQGVIYGLVLPGYEMASVLVDRLGGKTRRFRPADQSAILKLNRVEVAAVGEYQADTSSFVRLADDGYRRIYVRNGRLVGAIGIGAWPEQARVREAIKRQRRIWPWHIRRFQARGELWRAAEARDVMAMRGAAEICNCMGVAKQEVLAACRAGCATVEAVAERTGASTICGSCRPLVARLVGVPVESRDRPLAGRALLAASTIGALLVALFVFVEVPFAATVTGGWKWEVLWTDRFLKQVSGFSLVGLALLSLVLSLRKRVRRFSRGDFGYWRAIHAGLGLLTLVMLITHTGLHLGHNLNFLLTVNFLALALFGSMAGGITALETWLDGAAARMVRKAWTTLHIVLAWPLPVLVLFHALASYYY